MVANLPLPNSGKAPSSPEAPTWCGAPARWAAPFRRETWRPQIACNTTGQWWWSHRPWGRASVRASYSKEDTCLVPEQSLIYGAAPPFPQLHRECVGCGWGWGISDIWPQSSSKEDAAHAPAPAFGRVGLFVLACFLRYSWGPLCLILQNHWFWPTFKDVLIFYQVNQSISVIFILNGTQSPNTWRRTQWHIKLFCTVHCS